MADMSNTEIRKLTGAVEEAITYPLPVTVARAESRRAGGTTSAYGGSVTETAQVAIRDLLGWRYRPNDPKGFLAALNKAIEVREVEGHVETSWIARPMMVQADLGEVTGAQASIYKRARAALDHALPLLDTLQPLRADADDEDTASLRAIVRSALVELVAELGTVGGPRVQRVNEYFNRLLGVTRFDSGVFQDPDFTRVLREPETVEGKLGDLAKSFGLRRDIILNVGEEQVFTDFLIVVDYTTGLFQTWVAQKGFIERNDDPNKFLGTQLVRLSQMLGVIVESVYEAYDAMDSVQFGPEERAVTEVIFDGDSRITVAELLGWVEHFAGVEGPRLIEDSGKYGVDAVRTTLERLRDLVGTAVLEPPTV